VLIYDKSSVRTNFRRFILKSKFCRNAGKRHCIPIKITNFAPVITLKPDEGGRVVADIDGKAFTL